MSGLNIEDERYVPAGRRTDTPRVTSAPVDDARRRVIYTIRYSNPRSPSSAGLTIAFDVSQIDALKARLVRDGYIITEVSPTEPARVLA